MHLKDSSEPSYRPVPDFGRRPSRMVRIHAAPEAGRPRIFTDFDWAEAEAARAGNLMSVTREWETSRARLYADAHAFVMDKFRKSRQTVLYTLAPSDIVKATFDTEHSLGDVSAAEARHKDNRRIASFSPSLPMILVLHDLMERLGRIPLWQDFVEHLFTDHRMGLGDFVNLIGIDFPRSISSLWVHPQMRAVRYRLGNAHYSFIREIGAISGLRTDHDLDIRYHPHIDVNWKADMVCGRVRVELFVPNEEYKDDASKGRKRRCRDLNPDLPVVTKTMKPSRIGGQCWLFPPAEIEKLAADIRSAL